jgi:hypothetical protein
MAMDDGPPVAWHVQDITVGDAAFVTEYGIARGLGLSLTAFYRQARTRIRFEDDARQKVVAPGGDIHHRDETLDGPGDPWALLVAGGNVGPWSLAARGGVSIPLGRTEENPFELGRRGLAHQHIQFGTGTWNPMAGVSLGRRLGPVTLAGSVLARLVVSENDHGYRAGNRYDVSVRAERRLGSPWLVAAGLDLAREDAERWNGVIEEEGNLGRTDLLAGFTLARLMGAAGGVTLQVRVPLLVRANSAQVDYPVIVSVGWSR